MGQLARLSRCERFIEAFNDLAVKMHHVGDLDLDAQGLGAHEGWDQVFLYVTIRGRELMAASPLFFDPEETDEDLIDRVRDVFVLSRKKAVSMLLKAVLIRDPKAAKGKSGKRRS